jgi:hypothetical protein
MHIESAKTIALEQENFALEKFTYPDPASSNAPGPTPDQEVPTYLGRFAKAPICRVLVSFAHHYHMPLVGQFPIKPSDKPGRTEETESLLVG